MKACLYACIIYKCHYGNFNVRKVQIRAQGQTDKRNWVRSWRAVRYRKINSKANESFVAFIEKSVPGSVVSFIPFGSNKADRIVICMSVCKYMHQMYVCMNYCMKGCMYVRLYVCMYDCMHLWMYIASMQWRIQGEENPAMVPIQIDYRLWPSSNEEINVRYWKTY